MTIQPNPNPLFEPISIGSTELKHRIVMAPMTRLRSDNDTAVPGEAGIEYYTQRASDGGLIIAEGVVPLQEGKGWNHSPGIWSREQIQMWKRITDGVHEKGGKMFIQLFAAGRVADPTCTTTIYAPSDIHDPTPGAHDAPLKVMTQEDIERNIEAFVQGAKDSIEAGFDGVEIHAANGYLLDQFLQSTSNQRTDQYGGSLENRFRFPLQILKSVSAAIGADKVGFRISPYSTFQGMRDPNIHPLEIFVPFTKTILEQIRGLAYFHVILPRVLGGNDQDSQKDSNENVDPIRGLCIQHNVPLIVAGGFKVENLKEWVDKYPGDLIAFGRYFTSNPDLPARIKNNWPLVKYDRSTFYTPGNKGYTDWAEYQAVHQYESTYSQPESVEVKA